MKIAIITGKTPGGGVATYIDELCLSLKEFGNVEVNRYIFKTSVMTKKETENAIAKNWTLIDNDGYGVTTLNSNDYVFAIGHVCHKQVKEGEVESFIDMMYKVTTKKAIFFNEHNPSSIKRNYGLDYICQKDFLLSFDYIMQFDNFTSSAKLIQSIIGEDEYMKRFVPLLLMYHFHNESNWGKPEYRIKAVEYLGRFVNIKDPQRLIRGKDKFDAAGYMLEMRGLIRMISLIGVPDLCYKFVDGKATKEPTEKCFWTSKGWYKDNNYESQDEAIYYPIDKRNGKIFVYGSYDNKTIYNTCKNAAFACDFLGLRNPEGYCRQMVEYAMYEYADNGMIMLLDKSLGEHGYFMKDGEFTKTRFIDVDSGIYLAKDLSNIDEVIDKMNYLYDNPDEYEKFRKTAFEYWKELANPEKIVNKLLNDIKNK